MVVIKCIKYINFKLHQNVNFFSLLSLLAPTIFRILLNFHVVKSYYKYKIDKICETTASKLKSHNPLLVERFFLESKM